MMAQGGKSWEEQFKNFAKFGDSKADGKTITKEQIEEWFKQANVFDEVSTEDLSKAVEKLKAKTIDSPAFIKLVEDLAKQANIAVEEIKDKLAACNLPGTK